MRRFTLAQLYGRGYNLTDIDHMIHNGLATYSSKSGAIVLMIEDILSMDEYFNELRYGK